MIILIDKQTIISEINFKEGKQFDIELEIYVSTYTYNDFLSQKFRREVGFVAESGKYSNFDLGFCPQYFVYLSDTVFLNDSLPFTPTGVTPVFIESRTQFFNCLLLPPPRHLKNMLNPTSSKLMSSFPFLQSELLLFLQKWPVASLLLTQTSIPKLYQCKTCIHQLVTPLPS